VTVALGTSLSFAATPAVVALILGAVVFVAIGALTHEHERAFSSAVIYLIVGLVAAAVISLFGLPWFGLLHDPHVLQRVAEITLVFALFATGLRIARFNRIRSVTVLLLLGIVMTVTVAAVAAFGTLLMGLSLGAAIILGGILAPTDPVLAGSLGARPPLEAEEEQRDAPVSLSVESGFNDGIAAPFVLLGVFVAQHQGVGWLGTWLLTDVLYGVGVAAVVGVLGGYGISAFALWLRGRGLVADELDGWVAIGTALAVFGLAQTVGSYGFVAAFVGGIAFRRYERGSGFTRRVHQGADVARNFAELGTILLFASMIDFSSFARPGVAGWLLVPALLLVIRPVAVLLTLGPVPMPGRERLFLAWFGVKGVATLYYVGFLVAKGVLSPAETATVTWTATAVVIVSVVAHGVTATRLRATLLTKQ
jgi:NhaP-type Na+/H+ or K+/H+ antiporter